MHGLLRGALLLSLLGASAVQAHGDVYQLEGRVVSKAKFRSFEKALQGQFNWVCEKTSFGGVTAYTAHDATGKWFRVRLSTGGGSENPSSIEPTAAPTPR